jgi:3-isopropylmalate dehydratase
VDHKLPTKDRNELSSVETFILEVNSRTQVLKLAENVRNFGLEYFGMADKQQGIVHIIGQEQSLTLPGTTCV